MIVDQPLLPSALVSGALLGARRELRRSAPIRLGSPGRCGTTPSLTISIDDRSPSIWMYGGADPVGRRYEELSLAFRRMARTCHCGECLVAALSFDTPDGDLTPVRIARKSYRRTISSYFREPKSTMGRSELLPALARADELSGANPGHAVHVVVLTDWELFEDFATVKEQLSHFDHVLAVGLNRPIPEWVVSPTIHGHQLRFTDPSGVLAKAMFGELTRGRVDTTFGGGRS